MVKTYYHVAHPSYQMGQDLLSLQQLISEQFDGDADAAKEAFWHWHYNEDYDTYLCCVDSFAVSLFETLAETRTTFSELHGPVLEITLDDEEYDIRRNAEGYPIVMDRIPADCIKIRRDNMLSR